MNTADWHKSTYSSGSQNCVEVSEGTETRVRDTQNRELGHLGFEAGEWTVLLGTLTK
ncbi:DUF397 domain-containing protein [Nocardiopsis lambiniae]|uniref:DUF397 domain-containing protein n=1 Tax=Nocardiopsis lambiniae TaxID=3075539 RepID=A0ABU2M8A6_9ACTN|nr:DUF397 domain-containing protein [Nocardiopsis sp. DSM 44743]MDT0328481.1 DUF397 domain-containing protein [Nocardiopsis sp. DSM 44743]